MTCKLSDRGATDPILVIAAIAVSLILLVGGSFAVAGMIANGKNLNAKKDLEKVAVAETARAASFSGAGATSGGGAAWSGAANASPSTNGSRTNAASDPAATGQVIADNTLGWTKIRGFGSGAYGTYANVSGASDGPAGTGLSTYLRKKWSAAAAAQTNTGFELTNASAGAAKAFPVSAGDTWTLSAYLRASSAHSDAQMEAQFYNSSGSLMLYSGANYAGGTKVSLAPGSWGRVDVTFTVPAGAVGINVFATMNGAAGWAVGDTLDGTGLLAEKTGTLGAYFDGGAAPAEAAGPFIPYLTGSSATTLSASLNPTGGAVNGTDLEHGDIGFTPSEGSRVGVLTNAAGTAWVAVAKSGSGSIYIRTSAGTAVGELSGTAGSRTVPSSVTLPEGVTSAQMNTALTNAGGF